MNDEQCRLRLLAENLLATLDAVVQDDTEALVIQTRTALQALLSGVSALRTREPTTWTFCGHWAGDTIVVDYELPGAVQDDRSDDNDEYPEGLWAASGSGYTVEEAERNALSEYIDIDDEEQAA